MTRSFWAPAAVAVVAGLLLLLAAVAGWVDGVDARNVGRVVVREPTSTSGTVFAPTGVVFGLAALLGGVTLGVVRGPGRRAAGIVIAVLGLAGLVVVVVGITRAVSAEGTLTPAPWLAALSACGVTVAGVAAVRGPTRPPDASRYRVEGEQPTDDEWSVAAEDEPPR